MEIETISEANFLHIKDVVNSSYGVKHLTPLLPKIPRHRWDTSEYPMASVMKCGGYMEFGTFCEQFCRLFPTEEEDAKNCIELMEEKAINLPQSFIDLLNESKDIMRERIGRFLPSATTILYDQEFFEPIPSTPFIVTGHPDGVYAAESGEWVGVMECKMTKNPSKEIKSFYRQVLAYAAFTPTAKYAFLLLPLQKMVLNLHLGRWKGRMAFHAAVIDVARHIAPKVFTQEQIKEINRVHEKMVLYGVGVHVSINDLSVIYPGAPAQFFISAQGCDRIEVPIASNRLAVMKNIRAYLHAPYTVNLCNPPQQVMNKLKSMVRNAVKSKVIRGITFHVGHYCEMDRAEAETTFRKNVLELMSCASDTCPIMLETPASNKEVLNTAPLMLEFVKSVGSPALKITLDTCHVFASGSNIVQYFDTLKGLIGLIHFNDSREPFNSQVDRHAQIGQGEIDIKLLENILDRAHRDHIDMVVE